MLKKTNNKGFTFIELILYIAILAVFMVAVTTLVGNTVTSHRKQNSKKKLENQAMETYETISDMFMSATDVRIKGEAYVLDESNPTSVYEKKNVSFVTGKKFGNFVYDTDKTNQIVYGDIPLNMPTSDGASSLCYDMAKIKSYSNGVASGVGTTSNDPETYIYPEYLFIKYTSGVDSSTKENIYTYCTLYYDSTDKALYIVRIDKTETEDKIYRGTFPGDAYKYMNGKSLYGDSAILCKNVENFRLQVDPETQSFVVLLDYKDAKTKEVYDTNGVVTIRNSNVFEK